LRYLLTVQAPCIIKVIHSMRGSEGRNAISQTDDPRGTLRDATSDRGADREADCNAGLVPLALDHFARY